MAVNTDQPRKRSALSSDLLNLCILLAIALCVGVYLIATTVLIARDGLTFIDYARDFQLAPIDTMLGGNQHPGYPLMVSAVYSAAGLFCDSSSLFTWIYSAQATTLFFRLLTIVLLYFLGKDLVGPRFSFWAVLIIILLPLPAYYGSDALSDWPHLFFLTAGMFLSIRAAAATKLYLFALAGIAAGLGYLIRPECVQVIVYCVLWLIFQLLARKAPNWPKAAVALVVLMACALIVVGPYMRLKTNPLPKKDISVHDVGEFNPPETSRALLVLGSNIGDTLEWIFVPALLVGLYKSFRKTSLLNPKQFFIIVLVALNIVLMIWLYDKFCYMDKRHTLPLVLFIAFYIPTGIDTLASWFAKIRIRRAKRRADPKQLIFYVLLIVAIAAFIPQLFQPLRHNKRFFRQAAQWISDNTLQSDLLAVSDPRIAFYAQRSYVPYAEHVDSNDVKYAAIVLKAGRTAVEGYDPPARPVVFSLESKDGKSRLVIYGPHH